jgi:hypothetical protein
MPGWMPGEGTTMKTANLVKSLTTWALFNAAAVAAAYLGIVEGNKAALNIITFLSWLMFITSFIFVLGTLGKQAGELKFSRRMDERPGWYTKLDMIFDLIFACAIASAGEFLLAVVYLLHSPLIHGARSNMVNEWKRREVLARDAWHAGGSLTRWGEITEKQQVEAINALAVPSKKKD